MATPAGITEGEAVSDVHAGVFGVLPFIAIPVRFVPEGSATVVVVVHTKLVPFWVQVVAEVPLVDALCAQVDWPTSKAPKTQAARNIVVIEPSFKLIIKPPVHIYSMTEVPSIGFPPSDGYFLATKKEP